MVLIYDILRVKNIVPYALSVLHSNGNKDTTQQYTYKKEVVSEINDTKEFPEGTFPINLKWSNNINRKKSAYWLNMKLECTKKGLFCGGSDIQLKLITCKYKEVIPPILEKSYYIGIICIPFIREWIEGKKIFANMYNRPA